MQRERNRNNALGCEPETHKTETHGYRCMEAEARRDRESETARGLKSYL